MKIAIGIIFGLLTAAAVGLGIYFFLDESERFKELTKEHSDLTARVALNRQELKWWEEEGKPEELKTKLDSRYNELTFNEPYLPQILTVSDSQVSTSRMVVSEAEKNPLWNKYPFELTLEGELTSVRRVISDLSDELPLMQINRIEAGLIDDVTMEFNLIGSVWFPREVTKEQSIEKIVPASAGSL